MAGYPSLEMMYEQDDRDYKQTAEEDDEEIKKTLECYYKNIHKEDRGSDESGPYYLYDDEEEYFDEIKDPRQAQDAAAAAAVNKVLEEIIQSPASKKICDVHHLDQQILTKVLGNLKDSIAQETLNQLTNRLQLAVDNEIASPVPLQAPPHDDKLQAHEQQQERKRKLTSYIPDSAAAAVNNVSEEMTQLPASKKICYAHDDHDEEKPLKNLITQETSINLQNVSEQLAVDNEIASPVPLQAPPHDDKVQQAPDSAAAAAAATTTLNKEMTQLPASKKIRYAHDDDEKSLKNLITQKTSINLQNVSEQPRKAEEKKQ